MTLFPDEPLTTKFVGIVPGIIALSIPITPFGKFAIDSVPTVVLVQDRHILNGLVGVQEEESLELLIGMYAR